MDASSFCRALVTLVCVIFLGSCASAPLGTLWEVPNLTQKDLVEAKPESVRVAVQSDPVFLDNLPPARLELSIEGDGQSHSRYVFVLQPLDQVSLGLPRPKKDTRWQNFRLADAEIEAFRAMQGSVYAQLLAGTKRRGNFSVGFSLAPKGTKGSGAAQRTPSNNYRQRASVWAEQGLPFALAVQLFPEDSFLLVREPTRIDFNHGD